MKAAPLTLADQLIRLANVDVVVDRAVQCGAKVTMQVQDTFWGDRYGKIEDPFGHHWSVATHIRDVRTEEMEKAARGNVRFVGCCSKFGREK